MDITTIHAQTCGGDETFQGPFGRKPVIYADWTASGRAYAPIEEAIRSEVLPFYANTHTGSSITGLQSSWYREEARQIIQQGVNANSKLDCVLFTGSGCTAAINKIVGILGLQTRFPQQLDEAQRPVIFIGPQEHHSNMLPWRESCADVVNIPESSCGQIDLAALERALQKYAARPLKIGSFSAASNVTGVLADVDAVTATLHRGGALAFWDYATAAPYVKVDMNPVLPGDHADRSFVSKDAVFFSPHKFLGGVNSPGVLVMKKALLNNLVPAPPNIGGGTVFFVTDDAHRYLSNRAEREEGGTPDIVGTIRAGLAFKLKQDVGSERICKVMRERLYEVHRRLAQHPKIKVLGPPLPEDTASMRRLPVFSFVVQHSPGVFLHHNFVSAVLNDLYGIQSRGGCLCAGPYVQRLLGMSHDSVEKVHMHLAKDPKHTEYLRPGCTRFTISYTMPQSEVDYVVSAVQEIAENGWRLLPLYRFNQKTGGWKHKARLTKEPQRKWLTNFDLSGLNPHRKMPERTEEAWDFPSLLKEAAELMQTSATKDKDVLGDQRKVLKDGDLDVLWFLLPSDAQHELQSSSNTPDGNSKPKCLIDPQAYWQRLRGTYAVDDITAPARVAKKKVAAEDACKDGVCFKKRKVDKYPLRTKEIIRTAEAEESASVETKTLLSSKPASLRPSPPMKIMRHVGRAIKEWDMIKDGDKILLGLSGGKDSLALLHILLTLQKRAPVRFEIGACTIDPGTEAYDPSPLIPYMASLKVPYHYVKTAIFEDAKNGALEGTSICSYCARMKRGALYNCARKNGYTKLVLAQHLDDFAETMLMGLLHNGQLRSMKANYLEKQGDVHVIRPLCYVREDDLKQFSYSSKLPVINENCPACFEAPQERRRVKKLLAQEEALSPHIFNHMRRALIPLMDEDTLTQLKTFTAQCCAKGKPKAQQKGKQRVNGTA